MSLNLLLVMAVFIVTDFVVELLDDTWKEGFQKEKCIKGAERRALVLIGYSAFALIAYFAGQKASAMEYLSGLLLEPIARYFVSLLNRLRGFIVKEQETYQSQPEPETEKPKETVVTLQAAKKK